MCETTRSPARRPRRGRRRCGEVRAVVCKENMSSIRCPKCGEVLFCKSDCKRRGLGHHYKVRGGHGPCPLGRSPRMGTSANEAAQNRRATCSQQHSSPHHAPRRGPGAVRAEENDGRLIAADQTTPDESLGSRSTLISLERQQMALAAGSTRGNRKERGAQPPLQAAKLQAPARRRACRKEPADASHTSH